MLAYLKMTSSLDRTPFSLLNPNQWVLGSTRCKRYNPNRCCFRCLFLPRHGCRLKLSAESPRTLDSDSDSLHRQLMWRSYSLPTWQLLFSLVAIVAFLVTNDFSSDPFVLVGQSIRPQRMISRWISTLNSMATWFSPSTSSLADDANCVCSIFAMSVSSI